MSIKQRITDWRRERRIRYMTRLVAGHLKHGNKDAARCIDQWRMKEIRARSPQQVERMERAQGLQA